MPEEFDHEYREAFRICATRMEERFRAWNAYCASTLTIEPATMTAAFDQYEAAMRAEHEARNALAAIIKARQAGEVEDL